MFDLLIKNGAIIDGSGSPSFRASIIVQNETIKVYHGDPNSLEASRTIDADGMVVCPGFIDVHSHAGLTILGLSLIHI